MSRNILVPVLMTCLLFGGAAVTFASVGSSVHTEQSKIRNQNVSYPPPNVSYPPPMEFVEALPEILPTPIVPPADLDLSSSRPPAVHIEYVPYVIGVVADAEGVIVRVIPSYGGAAAGLQVGDKIVKVDDIVFDPRSEVAKSILMDHIGAKMRKSGNDRVSVQVARGTSSKTFSVTTKVFDGIPGNRDLDPNIEPTPEPQGWRLY